MTANLQMPRIPWAMDDPLAFMAAIASFLIGGCLSIAMAIAQLKARHALHGGFAAWIMLAISFAADGPGERLCAVLFLRTALR